MFWLILLYKVNSGKLYHSHLKYIFLAKELNISPSIIYGVYLESLPNGRLKAQEFAKYNNGDNLISSDIATRNILFDAVEKRSLENAIEKMKTELFKRAI